MGLGLGALLGGGVAAAQGKDPLQGALMGGLGGALGGAFMPAAGGVLGSEAAAAGAGAFNPAAAPGVMDGVTGAISSGGVGAAGAGSGGIGAFLAANKYPMLGGLAGGMMASNKEPEQPSAGNIYDYDYTQEKNPNFGAPGERYFSSQKFNLKGVTPVEDYKPMAAANGGIVALAEGGNVSRFRNPAGAVNPAVAAYNAQLMERANAQYNVNPRPAPNQVPGFDYNLAQPQTTQTTQTTQATGTDTAAATGSVDPISGKATRYNPVTKRFEGEYGSSAKSELDKYREELFAELDARYGGRYSDPGNSGGGSGDSGAPGSEAPGDSPGADGSDGGEGGDGEKNGGLIKHRYAVGGLSSIGNYSDGGQLLRGPGDGVSDSIPAQIGRRQPARLADGEFVVPARIVSEIGNGSTAAGAKRLYAMMDRVQKGRTKTVGKGKVAVDSKAHKMLPV